MSIWFDSCLDDIVKESLLIWNQTCEITDERDSNEVGSHLVLYCSDVEVVPAKSLKPRKKLAFRWVIIGNRYRKGLNSIAINQFVQKPYEFWLIIDYQPLVQDQIASPA